MFDLVIIGGGPAGLTAGIYAQRARLKTVLLEKQMVGGQIAVSDVIENYPGFPSISGAGLMEKFEEHARGLGLEIRFADVINITVENEVKVIKTSEGEIRTKAIIIATGAKPKRLGVPGEKELTGKGVSYCATCDGPFFRNLKVMVVGPDSIHSRLSSPARKATPSAISAGSAVLPMGIWLLAAAHPAAS